MLVLNQYYWPGVEATAHLLSQLCEALADDFDITVVTGRLLGHDELQAEEVAQRRPHRARPLDRVRAVGAAPARGQLRLLPRRAPFATALREPKPDLVLCMTDPPIVGDIGLVVARRFGVPLLVISQDVFPEIAVQLKRLENPVLVGVLRSLVGLYLRRADGIVAIGETMKRRLEEKGAPPGADHA